MVRIGILTYYASINYGAFLQAYSLQKALEKRYRGKADVEIISFDMKVSHCNYIDEIYKEKGASQLKAKRKYDAFVRSRSMQCLSKDSLISDELNEFKEFTSGKYDIIIVGSDEIWKTDGFRGFPNPYWMNFELQGTDYLAYAVSGRNDYGKMASDMQDIIKESVGRFKYIGTRDKITREELRKITQREIHRNCDPTFLLQEEFFLSKEKKELIKRKYGFDGRKPIISIMLSNRELGGRLYRMLRYDNTVVRLYTVYEDDDRYNIVDISPLEWSEIIGISDLVITDFFHGTVFSILHEVPFVAIDRSEKGRGKIENLLMENLMEDKFVFFSDYGGNIRGAARDLYTRCRREMRSYDASRAKRAKKTELKKAESFFVVLDEYMN